MVKNPMDKFGVTLWSLLAQGTCMTKSGMPEQVVPPTMLAERRYSSKPSWLVVVVMVEAVSWAAVVVVVAGVVAKGATI